MPPPALAIQFGSAVHSVYTRPVRQDQLVVAPSLFGSELNVTTFHDLRDELEGVMRETRNEASWSFETVDTVVTLPGRGLTAKSGTVRDVVCRICEYFSIDAGSVGVGLAYRRREATCRYRGGATYVIR